jgi:integrase
VSGSAIAIAETGGVPTELVRRATDYATAAKAERTRRAYATDWADFEAWCAGQGLAALPALPTTVGVYLADQAATHRPATLSRRLAAISVAHRQAGHPLDTRHPAIKDVMTGIRRESARAGVTTTKKAAAIADDIRAMVNTLAGTPIGHRDRALLLLGFAGAFRRSELVGLNVADLEFRTEGVAVTIRRSKTDQEGQGHQVAICYGSDPRTCPVRALRTWLAATGITEGPLFRAIAKGGRIGQVRLSDKGVALIVKRSAKAAGRDPALYGGHSLRSGFATTAAANGATEAAIMRQTGHRSVAVVRGYIRSGGLFMDSAAAKLGL